MANISAYDSSSIGVLFSSIQNKNRNASSLFSGGADILGINYSDYATIKSGSYFKLLSAYYSKDGASSEVNKMLSTSTSKDSAKTLARVESAANKLKDSSDALLSSGKDSVFNKVTTTDAEGKTSTDYDKDAIYKSVKSFVDDYNNVLSQAADSNTSNIRRAAIKMINYSKVNEKALAKIGITIGDDNQLKIDKEAFQKADMEKVKSMFNARGSYGYQIKTQASLAETYAKSEAVKSNTYSSKGGYTYNYNTGKLYNSIT